MEVKVNLKIEFQESFELFKNQINEDGFIITEGFLNQIKMALSEAVAKKKVIINSWKISKEPINNIPMEFTAIIPEEDAPIYPFEK